VGDARLQFLYLVKTLCESCSRETGLTTDGCFTTVARYPRRKRRGRSVYLSRRRTGDTTRGPSQYCAELRKATFIYKWFFFLVRPSDNVNLFLQADAGVCKN
jgi:hypothetical protein